ncbi:MAG: NmrA family NAD(P)-binding protein [Spirochaetaceae bacterium]
MGNEICYLVTGATGNVGEATVRALLKAGRRVRGGVRDPQRLISRFDEAGERLEAQHLDFDGSEPDPSLFNDVSALLLVRPPQVGDVETLMFPFLRAAKRAGVVRVVLLSLLGAQWLPFVPHRKLEKEIRRLGFEYTYMRAGFFMQNLEDVFAHFIRDEGELPVPAGRSVTSFVDARDLGEAAAQLLLADARPPKEVELTGPEAMSYADVARVLTDTLGRNVEYTAPKRLRFEERARAAGWDEAYVTVVSRLFITVRLGMARKVTEDLERILGRPPRRLGEYVADQRHLWLQQKRAPGGTEGG